MGEQATLLREIAGDKKLMEIARKAIEDSLIEWRDMRLSTPLRNNGLVIKESDGTNSNIIRMGPEEAVALGLRAIAESFEQLP